MRKERCEECKIKRGSEECNSCSLNYESKFNPKDKKTCKGCTWNRKVSGIQICLLPFKFGGDVHTVSAISDATMRCLQYELKGRV